MDPNPPEPSKRPERVKDEEEGPNGNQSTQSGLWSSNEGNCIPASTDGEKPPTWGYARETHSSNGRTMALAHEGSAWHFSEPAQKVNRQVS